MVQLKHHLALLQVEVIARDGIDKEKLQIEQQLVLECSTLSEINHIKWALRSREDYIK